MGSAFACCETKKEEHYEDEEIKLKSSYNALSNDFLKIEPQYNYLNKITFTEFSVLLSKYTDMTSTINYDSKKPIDIFHKSKFYSTNFDEEQFQSFIETKYSNVMPYMKYWEKMKLYLLFSEICSLKYTEEYSRYYEST